MLKSRLLAAVLACFLLAGCESTALVDIVPDGSATIPTGSKKTAVEAPELAGYTAAAANGKYALYYEPEGLTIAVLVRSNGQVITSSATPDENFSSTWKNFVNSGIVVEYYKGSATVINRADLYSGKPDKEITYTENGFAAKLTFKSLGISLAVSVELTDTGVEVLIPNSSVAETNDNIKLAAIWAYPFFGYTHSGDTEGYMLIPDGCGALIPLVDNNGRYSQPYKAAVYGYDYSVAESSGKVQKFEDEIPMMTRTNTVSAPFFGMVHTKEQTGFLGIIDEGSFNSEIYAYPNGVITDYNWIAARFVYRQLYLHPTGQKTGITGVQSGRETFDLRLRFLLTEGDDASYTGLAKKYREYLVQQGVLTDREKDYGIRLDFFAGDEQKALIGKEFVTMTTAEEMSEIIGELVTSGCERIFASYKGWQKNGIYGDLNGTGKTERALGGLSVLTEISEKYDTVDISLYADLQNVYSRNDSRLIYRYNGRLFSDETYLTLHELKYRLQPEAAKELLIGLSALPFGVTVDGITNELYSFAVNHKKALYSRKRVAGDYAEMLSAAGGAAYCRPNNYLWQSTARYYDFALYGSDYKFTSDEIPFLAIVLKGVIPLYSEYVNFKADGTEYLLRMIESGVYPSFLLTRQSPSRLIYTDSADLYSTEYKEYREMILRYDEIFKNLDKATANAQIASHNRVNGIGITVYTNGTAVYVNYNDTDYSQDGISIAAHSYLIRAGEGV